MSSPVACVTGATGFVANELIKQLLERGYKVRATCRCPSDSPKLAALRQFGAVDLIQVPDILKPSRALDSAVHGVKYLFHVASPFRFDGDPVKDIVEPAVEGTKTVLEAASRSEQPISRVILTSSVCAIHDQHRAQVAKEELYSEDDWNNVSKVEDQAYWVSKVEAERVAWQLAEQYGMSLVTILPNFVLGATFNPEMTGVSVSFMKDLIETGPEGKVSGSWTICDVRDVAAAHIKAAEEPSASGRYVVTNRGPIDGRFITDVIKQNWPAAGGVLPDGEKEEGKEVISNDKVVQGLGVTLHPPAETIRDMVESLLKLGVAKPAWYTSSAAARSN